jgi:pyrimidine-nucleoside phosphorylase
VELNQVIDRVGCAITGQTAEIAPADRRLYALRDVTGTIESVALITSSIMSKKIAEGLDALVLDVKTGRGAFMKTRADARRLAESLVGVGRSSGIRTEALVTAMDAPLGRAIGNALEVIEATETLKGQGAKDVEALSVLLAARMLVLSGLASTDDDAERRVRGALASGAGLERWGRLIEAQGGDRAVVDDYRRLPMAAKRHLLAATRSGHVATIDAELAGRAAVALGAGRVRIEDTVDPAVGIMLIATPGAAIAAGDPLAVLSYQREADLPAAVALIEQAIAVADEPPPAASLVIDRV